MMRKKNAWNREVKKNWWLFGSLRVKLYKNIRDPSSLLRHRSNYQVFELFSNANGLCLQ